jgi:hypothetical protein
LEHALTTILHILNTDFIKINHISPREAYINFGDRKRQMMLVRSDSNMF